MHVYSIHIHPTRVLFARMQIAKTISYQITSMFQTFSFFTHTPSNESAYMKAPHASDTNEYLCNTYGLFCTRHNHTIVPVVLLINNRCDNCKKLLNDRKKVLLQASLIYAIAMLFPKSISVFFSVLSCSE